MAVGDGCTWRMGMTCGRFRWLRAGVLGRVGGLYGGCG